MSTPFTPGRYRITSTPTWGRVEPGTSGNRGATIGDVVEINSIGADFDGDVLGDVCGWVRASCLTPVDAPDDTPVSPAAPDDTPAAPVGPTATVTLAEQVTETRHVEALVQVRYYRDGEDVTDRVVAKVDAPTSTSDKTYQSVWGGGGEVHIAASASRGGTAFLGLNGVHATSAILDAETARAVGRHLVALADEWEARQ